MALLGNIIWFVFGGWALFIIYFLGAILFFPMFIPLARLAVYAAWPFGKEVVTQAQLENYRKVTGKINQLSVAQSGIRSASSALNIFWMLSFGWILALAHFFSSIVNLCFFWMVITIPNILGNWKLIGIALMPFNKVVVPKAVADDIKSKIVQSNLNI